MPTDSKVGSENQNTAFKSDVFHCARCGQDHRALEFKAFAANPIEDSDGTLWRWWALCPVVGEPILMREDTAGPQCQYMMGSAEQFLVQCKKPARYGVNGASFEHLNSPMFCATHASYLIKLDPQAIFFDLKTRTIVDLKTIQEDAK